MTDAGRDRKEQERKPDQDVIEDLAPGDAESAELDGGRGLQVGTLGRRES
jgi:hypothetical protein